MDSEFECLTDMVTESRLNTTEAREHVPGVEQQIQVVKERMRAVHSALSYEKLMMLMVIELGKFVIFMINAFPPKRSVSNTYSPRTIMTGNALDFKKHCRCPFGAYVQVHDDRYITNTMVERTQGAIFLGPTVNIQGSYACMSLRTAVR